VELLRKFAQVRKKNETCANAQKMCLLRKNKKVIYGLCIFIHFIYLFLFIVFYTFSRIQMLNNLSRATIEIFVSHYIICLFLDMDNRSSTWQKKWLDEKDGNGDVMSLWCNEPTNPSKSKAYCNACLKEILFGQHGVAALKSHAKSRKHVDKMLIRRTTSKIQVWLLHFLTFLYCMCLDLYLYLGY
jgi:hypothetical protein